VVWSVWLSVVIGLLSSLFRSRPGPVVVRLSPAEAFRATGPGRKSVHPAVRGYCSGSPGEKIVKKSIALPRQENIRSASAISQLWAMTSSGLENITRIRFGGA